MSLWTRDEVNDLQLAWDKFKERHPSRSYKAWWNKKSTGITHIDPETSEEVNEISIPVREEGSLREYFDKLLDAADMKSNGREREVEITERLSDIDDDRPIAVAFTGDWHVGQAGTNHRLLRQHNIALAKQPGLYVIGMGDYRHNAKAGMKPGNALYDSIFPDPSDQLAFVNLELEQLRGKIVGLIRGCHEDWDFQLAGIDSLENMCQNLGCHNLWHGGIVHLQIGKQTYHLGVRHKYQGESKTNTTNAQRNFYDNYPETEHLDVVTLGHLHYCDLQKRSRRGQQTVYLRSGSYHQWDEYGQKLGGFRAEAGVPIVILYPDRHKVLPFSGNDLDEALNFTGFIRNKR
jgi:hypothetical protein